MGLSELTYYTFDCNQKLVDTVPVRSDPPRVLLTALLYALAKGACSEITGLSRHVLFSRSRNFRLVGHASNESTK